MGSTRASRLIPVINHYCSPCAAGNPKVIYNLFYVHIVETEPPSPRACANLYTHWRISLIVPHQADVGPPNVIDNFFADRERHLSRYSH